MLVTLGSRLSVITSRYLESADSISDLEEEDQWEGHGKGKNKVVTVENQPGELLFCARGGSMERT